MQLQAYFNDGAWIVCLKNLENIKNLDNLLNYIFFSWILFFIDKQK